MLSLRLLEISKLLNDCDCVADIGSDHGLLPLDMLKNGKINFAVLCDLREKPLSHARQHFEEAHLTHRAAFYVSDGLLNVDRCIQDVIIAGMGFETIIQIVNQSLKKFKEMNQIIIQSNTKVHHVRKYMWEHAFELIEESFVEERGHAYVILKYKPMPKKEDLSLHQIYFGKHLLKTITPSYQRYLIKELKRMNELMHTKNPEISLRKDILIDILASK